MNRLNSVLIGVVCILFAGFDSVASAQDIVEKLRSGDRDAVVKMLSKKNAKVNVNEVDAEGLTPIMMATVANDTLLVDLLLSKGADPNIQANNGMTALMAAAFNTRETAMRSLLNGGAKPDLQDSKGRAALLVAAKQGVNNPVTLLLDARANIEIKDELGNTALIIACGERHLNVMLELLDKGANPNCTDIMGRTPLMLLSMLGEDDMIRELLRFKPDIEAMDFNLKTALSYAREFKRKYVIDVLEKAGAKL